MPRKKREQSNTGIYHVMLRGINRQQVFFDDDDYSTMVRVLADAHIKVDANRNITSRNDCSIYAYVVMPNHVHILIREGEMNISNVMRKIEDRYVYFYNKKYERNGPLFQGRFRSEPVNDSPYFHILLRYIHRNPVKGMICTRPEEYLYSSWREYLGMETVIPVCRLEPVLSRYSLDDLIEWVNEDIDDKCLDMDSDTNVINENTAWKIITEISDVSSIEDFRQLTADLQLLYLREAMHHGISIRQASRLSSLSYSKIQRELSHENSGISDNVHES